MKDNRVQYEIELPTAAGPVRSAVGIVGPRARLADLVPAAQHLTDLAVAQAVSLCEQSDKPITCAPGCGACCRQCVVISLAEVAYVADVLEAIPRKRRLAIRGRFDAIVADLEARNMIPGLLDPEFSETPPHVPILVDYMRLGHACPFLEAESCSIHPKRPTPCRDYNVTSPADLCRDPYANPIEKVATPTALSAPLALLCAELLQQEARLVPLVLVPWWVKRHPEIRMRKWPSDVLLRGLLTRLGSAGASGAT